MATCASTGSGRRRGAVLWVGLPQQVNAEQLFDDAIGAAISITPGPVYTPCGCYENFIRLSFGHQWCDRTEAAIAWLGQRIAALADT